MLKLATPPWSGTLHRMQIADMRARARFLKMASGIAHAVDHIVPIISDIVCGLNIPINMRIIPSRANLEKSNKLIEELAQPECVVCVLLEPLP